MYGKRTRRYVRLTGPRKNSPLAGRSKKVPVPKAVVRSFAPENSSLPVLARLPRRVANLDYGGTICEDSGEPHWGYLEIYHDEGVLFLVGPPICRNREFRIPALLGTSPAFWYRCKKTPWLIVEAADLASAAPLSCAFREISRYERRRRRSLRAEGFHTKEHLRDLWALQEGRCYFSGKPLGQRFEDLEFHVDHLVPLAAGDRYFDAGPCGTHWPDNLVLVAAFVNRGRGARRVAEYLAEVRRTKVFTPTSAKNRRLIDARRAAHFADFLQEHRDSGR